MAVARIAGDKNTEQARGLRLYSGNMRAYLVIETQPTVFHFLGGYRLEDAFDYEIDDFILRMEYVHENGTNKVIEHVIAEENIRSFRMEILAPSGVDDLLSRVFELQRNCRIDFYLVPDVCDDSCDTAYYYVQDVKIGIERFTDGVIAYDDNRGIINRARTLISPNPLQAVYGREYKASSDANSWAGAGTLTAYQDVVFFNDDCECDCPNQNGIAAVNVGVAGTFLGYTTDGGETWNELALSSSAATGIQTLTHLVELEDRVLFVSANNEVGYVWKDTLEVVETLTGAGTIARIDTDGSKVFVWQDDGRLYTSCNSGTSWTDEGIQTYGTGLLNVNPDSTDYDEEYQVMVYSIGDELWHMNTSSLVSAQIGAPAGATAASVILSIQASDRRLVFANAAGEVWETTDYLVASPAWSLVYTHTASIALDGLAYNDDETQLAAAFLDALFLRDGFTFGDLNDTEVFTTAPLTTDTARPRYTTSPLDEESELALYAAIDDEIWRYGDCYTCSDLGDC